MAKLSLELKEQWKPYPICSFKFEPEENDNIHTDYRKNSPNWYQDDKGMWHWI